MKPNGPAGALASQLDTAAPEEAARLELLTNARALVGEVTERFAAALIAQAKARAFADGADHVLVRHVHDALDTMLPRRRGRMGEALKIVGGALLGTGFSGFIASLPHASAPMTAATPVLLSLHAALGLLSVAMIGAGLFAGAPR